MLPREYGSGSTASSSNTCYEANQPEN